MFTWWVTCVYGLSAVALVIGATISLNQWLRRNVSKPVRLTLMATFGLSCLRSFTVTVPYGHLGIISAGRDVSRVCPSGEYCFFVPFYHSIQPSENRVRLNTVNELNVPKQCGTDAGGARVCWDAHVCEFEVANAKDGLEIVRRSWDNWKEKMARHVARREVAYVVRHQFKKLVHGEDQDIGDQFASALNDESTGIRGYEVPGKWPVRFVQCHLSNANVRTKELNL